MSVMEPKAAVVAPAATDYRAFLARKRIRAPSGGREVRAEDLHPSLFGFQNAVTRWAVRKGRAALFLSTGLGKTRCQLEWSRLLGERTLIVAPLGVARQTVHEAARIGMELRYARHQQDAAEGITITNYDMVQHFRPSAFGAVVLDESSVLKSLDSKRRVLLGAMFADTPYRLACTATPAPNDIAEIANHAEFLGVMRRADMLASFFVHDGKTWRLKGHAHDAFYRWLASWSMALRLPSDIGYDDEGYILPDLLIEPTWVDVPYAPQGQLFFTTLHGIGERASVRRATLAARVHATLELVRQAPDGEPWVLWCGLDEEQRALEAACGERCISIYGSLAPQEKEARLAAWLAGERPILLTKPLIAGFGLNLQRCARMAFVGLGDSWEQYYQCLRRCWRFGQGRPVHAYIVLSRHEEAVYTNVMNKEREALEMSASLVAQLRERARLELDAVAEQAEPDERDEQCGEHWRMLLGDSAERLAEIADASVHLSVYSPPFASLYTYSPSERDMGNASSEQEFFTHYGYIIDHLLRLTLPGRNTCVHVSDIPAMLVRDGYIGLKDFPGACIRAYEERGWIYHGRICIAKNPQAQAVRTKSKSLLFVQLRKDASWSRPALADYILVFRKPGENPIPIQPDITNDQWIEWAQPLWTGIHEGDTLQYTTARDEEDERHIAPLQLGTIERCVRLWSNPGEIVLSPFAGIGSEVYSAVQHGRYGLGLELKRSYWRIACQNMRRLEHEMRRPTLFDGLDGWSGASRTGGVAR